MITFSMPAVGEMESAMLVRWTVGPGDRVERGQVVAEIETDKGLIEIECWDAGTITELLVEPGPTLLPVGTALATLKEEPGARRRATPRARRLAAEQGLDLGRFAAGGVVTADDVLSETHVGEVPSMRAAIARSMTRSKQEIPHYYLESTIRLGRHIAWLDGRNENASLTERVVPAALLFSAVARSAARFADLNGHWTQEGFQPSSRVYLGIAVARRTGGVVAPAIPDADRLDLGEIMTAVRDLVTRAKSESLTAQEMSSATITVTSLGDRGTDRVTPVIIPPQVAIVGLGRIDVRPVVEDGVVIGEPTVSATLAADHRVSDGHVGSLFMEDLVRSLDEVMA